MSDQRSPVRGIGRRRFIAGAGVASAAAAVGGVGLASPAGAEAQRLGRALPIPEPIPGGVEAFPGDPASFIHWFLPGPPGSFTPVIGLPGMGLDVDPSTMTDFHGANAFTVVTGTTTADDGNDYDVEIDIRAMEGKYRAADGVERRGAFAFL